MSRRLRLWPVLAFATVLLLGSSPAIGQDPPDQHQPPAGSQKQEMSAKCQAMMAEHSKMMAELKEADQRLDSLVTTMNAATGQQKTDAIAAAVTELVSQRKAMREQMMAMQHRMMGHVAEHMEAGADSMAMCPMMKMEGMKKH